MGTPFRPGPVITAMDGVRSLLAASVLLVLLGSVSADGDKISGRTCLRSHHCAPPFSHCSRWGRGITEWECRLNIWVWVVIVLMVISVISCFCGCIFLPFCCLYKPFKLVRDVMCFWNAYYENDAADTGATKPSSV